jgi:hypothetical protein
MSKCRDSSVSTTGTAVAGEAGAPGAIDEVTPAEIKALCCEIAGEVHAMHEGITSLAADRVAAVILENITSSYRLMRRHDVPS